MLDALVAVVIVISIVSLFVFALVKLSAKSQEHEDRADYAERELRLIEKFNKEMSRPLLRGAALIDRLRSRMRDL